MLRLDPPIPVMTPIGDAMCHVLINPGIDHPMEFLCSINETGEFWCLSQPDVRLWTNITAGRTKVTPFSEEAMKRFEPMRKIAESM